MENEMVTISKEKLYEINKMLKELEKNIRLKKEDFHKLILIRNKIIDLTFEK